MSNNRDDFSKKTKSDLAERAGWKCSYPDCKQVTIGPVLNDHTKSINNGIAAHICAASPNGPRFDSSMTSEERKDITNGIWMCRNHANLIDANVSNYTVLQLQEWKKDAENLAYAALSNNVSTTTEENYDNLNRHRELINHYFKRINSYTVYYSNKKDETIIKGFDCVDFIISRNHISILFNVWPQYRPKIKDHLYISTIDINFFQFMDCIIPLYEQHEKIEDFRFDYNINNSFNLVTTTSDAVYHGYFYIESNNIFDDSQRRIASYDEVLYSNLIIQLSSLRALIEKEIENKNTIYQKL